MPSRLAISALLVTFAVPLCAQGRGGRGGADNRPEVTFPVDLPADDAKLAALKKEAMRLVDSLSTLSQQMVDEVFSFGELGMQEEETSKYLTGILEKNGFKVTRGFAGIPDGVVRHVGLGQAGHLARLRRRRHSAGESEAGRRLQGSARRRRAGPRRRSQLRRADEHHGGDRGEEDHGARAHDRARSTSGPASPKSRWRPRRTSCAPGMFKDVDIVLFAHVGSDLGVSYGNSGQNALISARFNFVGQAAHAAGAPWAGRSALDAVELMDVGWNFRREHLPLTQRSHYVITDGGDQPNVVPPTASVWYFFRETDSPLVAGPVRARRHDGHARRR